LTEEQKGSEGGSQSEKCGGSHIPKQKNLLDTQIIHQEEVEQAEEDTLCHQS